MIDPDITLSELKTLVSILTEKVLTLENEQRKNILYEPVLDFSRGDTAWMITATALVFLQTIPGLVLYYAGMSPRKHSLMTIAMQSFSVCCVVSTVWFLFGYSLAFMPGCSVIGGYSRFFMINIDLFVGHNLAPSIPESVFCLFELGFAVMTAALLCSACADRMKFTSMLLFVCLWHLLVYCPVAHASWTNEGFLNQAGVLDYAGGNVVHISAGMSGLISSIVVGKRYGFGK